MKTDPYNLKRFLYAQAKTYDHPWKETETQATILAMLQRLGVAQ